MLEAYERKKGYWIDACVEDQFRLVVDYANNGYSGKQWWNFTEERKNIVRKMAILPIGLVRLGIRW